MLAIMCPNNEKIIIDMILLIIIKNFLYILYIKNTNIYLLYSYNKILFYIYYFNLYILNCWGCKIFIKKKKKNKE